MYFVLIQGPSYRGLEFEAREQIREDLRNRLEGQGYRFVEYNWVWDEEDRCLLLMGAYERLDDAGHMIRMVQSMGFDICIRTRLPGDDPL
jgi:hypothetical protein